MKTISPQELQEQREAVLIDVRTPAEFAAAHIAGSHLVPLTELDIAQVRQLAKNQAVYIVCQSGGRATRACEKLTQGGLAETTVLEGGLRAWQELGLPVIKGQKAMSLERQVRIAAGALVLTGVGLGFGVHPAFFGLAAFVGAGLMFAGITDRCGMALVLARMPWNKRPKRDACSCATQSSP